VAENFQCTPHSGDGPGAKLCWAKAADRSVDRLDTVERLILINSDPSMKTSRPMPSSAARPAASGACQTDGKCPVITR
jgi:hypothetical protein